jgi:hypothetical protein
MDANARYEVIIKEEAARIRAEISGGLLFSKALDPNNPDHMIVAAYHYGQYIVYKDIQERDERIRQYKSTQPRARMT